MLERITDLFAEMMTAIGCDTWYECEEEWERMEDEMVSMGLPVDEVRAFFREMEEDL